MPEGDAVRRTAQQLDDALRGTTIVSAELRWPSLATADLTGWTTTEVVSRGKHLLHRFDSGHTLHSHRRMEGRWEIVPPAPPPRHHRLRAILTTERVQALGWQLGLLDLVLTTDEARLVGHLGPDVLGEDWDEADVLARLAARPDRPIGESLLDQRILAGLGTMWVSDLLFLQGTNPWLSTGDLSAEVLAKLLVRARRTLAVAVRHRVSSSTGSHRPRETTWTHARSGLPCRRCGTLIRVALAGDPPQQRTLFYCPRCQPGTGPGGLAAVDDGRPQRPLGSVPRRPVSHVRRRPR